MEKTHGRCHDQALWSILMEDWRLQPTGAHPVIHCP